MKLVTYNIRFGLGIDQRTDLGRIAETVRDADIVALQEVERFWKRSGMTDQPESLGNLLQDFYWLVMENYIIAYHHQFVSQAA